MEAGKKLYTVPPSVRILDAALLKVLTLSRCPSPFSPLPRQPCNCNPLRVH